MKRKTETEAATCLRCGAAFRVDKTATAAGRWFCSAQCYFIDMPDTKVVSTATTTTGTEIGL